MLGLVKVETKSYGVNPIVNKLIFNTINTDKKKQGKITIQLDSDIFVGYNFADIEKVFKIVNDLFEGIFKIFGRNIISRISNEQHLLPNKRIDSVLHIETVDKLTADINISNLFECFISNVDFYIDANDVIIGICFSVMEELYAK